MPVKVYEYVSPEVDHYTTVEDGLRVAHSVAATEDEIRQRDIEGYTRSLEGVHFRLAHVGEPLAPYEDPPDEREIAKRRAALEAERQHILDTIAALGGDVPAKPKRRAKK
jgi:hypothetical protein